MADNKKGRDKQAHDAGNRQRERELAADLSRGDEPEPPVDTEALDDVETELKSLEFPVTGEAIVATLGDRVIESAERQYTVDELVPDAAVETFESPEAVRSRIERPTVAAAMKRIVETVDADPNMELGTSQRDAYEKTFRALEAIDAEDEDEGIRVIGDWIVERIEDSDTLPGSRAVRRRAAEFCRKNGYQVRDDDWLGI